MKILLLFRCGSRSKRLDLFFIVLKLKTAFLLFYTFTTFTTFYYFLYSIIAFLYLFSHYPIISIRDERILCKWACLSVRPSVGPSISCRVVFGTDETTLFLSFSISTLLFLTSC